MFIYDQTTKRFKIKFIVNKTTKHALQHQYKVDIDFHNKNI